MPPADAAKVQCPTPQHLQAELAALAEVIERGESEDNWDKIERALIRFTAVVRGGGYKHQDVFVRGVGNKGIGLHLVDCLASDRGRLAGAAFDLLQTFSPRLGVAFQPLVLLYLPAIVKALGKPNKVLLKRAERCVTLIVSNCPIPAILTHLRNGLDDRSETSKRACAIAIELAVQEWDTSRWSEKDLENLEVSIKKMATDKDAQVRRTGKKVWASFQEVWPDRVDDFVAPLTPTSRKYLDLPPAGESGPSGPSRLRRPQVGLGRTIAAPSHPSAPPVTRLNSSTGSDRDRPTRSALGGGAQRTRIPSEPPEGRTSSDVHRARGPSAMDPLPRGEPSRLTRSASRVLNHASSSSSLASSNGGNSTSAATKTSGLGSKAVRPTLPTSVSSETTMAAPARRLAPPTRPTRPAERPERAEGADDDEPTRRSAPSTRSGSAQSYHSASSASSSRLPPSRRTATTPVAPVSEPVSAPPSGPSTTPLMARSPSDPTRTPSEVVTVRSTSDPTRVVSSVRARVTHIEKIVSESGTPNRPTPTRELQLAAGIPLPPDTPLADKPSAPGNPAYSPSLSMLLGKHKMPTEMDFTLADLSVDNNASDSPIVQRRVSGLPGPSASSISGMPGVPGLSPHGSSPSGLPQTSPVSHLISKFSPTAATPLRAGTVETTTPTATPTALPDERKISPLPRRIVEEAPAPASPTAVTPRSSKKRKTSDHGLESLQVPQPQPQPSLIDATPAPTPFSAASPQPQPMDVSPLKPRDPQPLISFFDSPAGAPPFQFGASAPARPRNSIFSALMGLAMDAPNVSTIETEAIQEDEDEEDEEGDMTVRLTAGEVLVDTPIETPMELADEDEGDGDETAILISRPVLEPLHIEAQPAEEPITLLVDPVVATQEPVETPLDIPAEPQAPTPAAEPAVSVEAVMKSPESAEQPMPTTPLPEVLAEFDALTEPETEPNVEPAVEEPPQDMVQDVLVESQPEPTPNAEQKASSPEPLVDTSDPIIEPEADKASPLQEMKEVFEEEPDLLKISTGSTEAAASTDVTAPVPQREPAAPPKRPSSAADRRPKSTLGARRREPVEKKSFRPVSRTAETKAAPAPARLARSVTAPTAASRARAPPTVPAPAAPAPAPKPVRQARAPQIVTAAKPAPPRAASATTTTATRTAGSNLFKPTAATAARAAATAAATTAHADAKAAEAKDILEPAAPARPASRPGSSLGQAPKAALASTTTSTAATATGTTRTRSAMGSTAASRAREAALPPIKRQRLKLTAPQESFRPGRAGNKSKASVLGAGSAGPSRRPVRPAARGKAAAAASAAVGKETIETLPLPGPDLRTALGKAAPSEPAAPAGKEAGEGPAPAAGPSKPSKPIHIPARLAVPDDDGFRTPAASVLSPPGTGVSSTCLSPASSRHTSYTSNSDRSYTSRPMASPSKFAMAPTARPLEPVLTPTHSANVSAITSSGQSALVAPVLDSPAIVHARRVSGIPASLKKTIAEEAARRKVQQQQQMMSLSSSPPSSGSRTMLAASSAAASPSLGLVSEDDDNYTQTPRRRTRSQRRATRAMMREELEREDEGEGEEKSSLSVIRHDVSTPTGKAASLLRRLDDERRVLSPRDANAARE